MRTNKPIQDLTGFAKTFFARHTLLNILTRYCVLTADRMLLVMRPYQIVATERILQTIEISTNYKQLGTLEAGGYVWHTTGSGKTLTSFKTAQLASKLPGVDKVLFVVDRKDLDYQTMREYDRFEKGAANSNTSTAVLKRQLGGPERPDHHHDDPEARRPSSARNKGHDIYSGHVVIIFDECHRSQFGDMHTAITKAFKRYNLFGFTGTPIFAVNAGTSGTRSCARRRRPSGASARRPAKCPPERHRRRSTPTRSSTRSATRTFCRSASTTSTPSRVGTVADAQVSAIDTEKALLAPERLTKVVDYTLEHFDQKTRRSEHYTLGERRVHGFNALFATASIEAAKRYYTALPGTAGSPAAGPQLKVGLIYSYAANEAVADDFLDEEGFETDGLDQSSRDFLEGAIQDYNAMFGTSFDTSSDKFQNYYKDLSLRLKNREIDLVIVVNMFLTGFDATTLNTLFVDKRLVNHGLIQAYSRTNRILNSVKTYGNIVSFRDLEEETNDAIALFGNKDAKGIVLLKPYAEYYDEYAEKVHELLERFPLGQPIVGESAQKAFIALFGQILRLQNILTAFDEFAGNEILTDRQGQDYRSVYLDLYAEFKKGR